MREFSHEQLVAARAELARVSFAFQRAQGRPRIVDRDPRRGRRGQDPAGRQGRVEARFVRNEAREAGRSRTRRWRTGHGARRPLKLRLPGAAGRATARERHGCSAR